MVGACSRQNSTQACDILVEHSRTPPGTLRKETPKDEDAKPLRAGRQADAIPRRPQPACDRRQLAPDTIDLPPTSWQVPEEQFHETR